MDWSGVDYLWIIVMCLSAVWTLILTAPIHCRASIAETLTQRHISTNLMKKQTHPDLGWPEGWINFQQIFILGRTLPLNKPVCVSVMFVDQRREGPSSPVNNQSVTLLLQCPAVKFVSHPEFFTVLHANYVSQNEKLQMWVFMWILVDVVFCLEERRFKPFVASTLKVTWFPSVRMLHSVWTIPWTLGEPKFFGVFYYRGVGGGLFMCLRVDLQWLTSCVVIPAGGVLTGLAAGESVVPLNCLVFFLPWWLYDAVWC